MWFRYVALVLSYLALLQWLKSACDSGNTLAASSLYDHVFTITYIVVGLHGIYCVRAIGLYILRRHARSRGFVPSTPWVSFAGSNDKKAKRLSPPTLLAVIPCIHSPDVLLSASANSSNAAQSNFFTSASSSLLCTPSPIHYAKGLLPSPPPPPPPPPASLTADSWNIIRQPIFSFRSDVVLLRTINANCVSKSIAVHCEKVAKWCPLQRKPIRAPPPSSSHPSLAYRRVYQRSFTRYLAICSAVVAVVTPHRLNLQIGGSEGGGTISSLIAVRFGARPHASLYSSLQPTPLGFEPLPFCAFVIPTNVSCALEFPMRKNRKRVELTGRSRRAGNGGDCVGVSPFCGARTLYARHRTLRTLSAPKKLGITRDRGHEKIEVEGFCGVSATLPNIFVRDISEEGYASGMHDTTKVQLPYETANTMSIHGVETRGNRSYRVVALFRPDLSLGKVRENVGAYVLQLRKWRCTRLKALYRGHRRLAYVIKGQESAHVVEITFDIFPSAICYLRMRLDADPAVLRFMILKNHPLPRSIVRRQHLIPPGEFGELLKYSGSSTT